MAWTEEDGKAMDDAAAKALNELRLKMEKMTAEERKGAQALIDWWNQNYMTAGYKRLGRGLKSMK